MLETWAPTRVSASTLVWFICHVSHMRYLFILNSFTVHIILISKAVVYSPCSIWLWQNEQLRIYLLTWIHWSRVRWIIINRNDAAAATNTVGTFIVVVLIHRNSSNKEVTIWCPSCDWLECSRIPTGINFSVVANLLRQNCNQDQHLDFFLGNIFFDHEKSTWYASPPFFDCSSVSPSFKSSLVLWLRLSERICAAESCFGSSRDSFAALSILLKTLEANLLKFNIPRWPDYFRALETWFLRQVVDNYYMRSSNNFVDASKSSFMWRLRTTPYSLPAVLFK